MPTTFPPLRAARPDPGDLPDRLTSFLGREREVDELADLAAMSRLVTLTGPGGIGKSSLAVEVARRLAPDFRDGAWFVPLATVDDPNAVEATIARSIGLYDGPERSAVTALPGYLADRSMLLVLDNFEQVLDAAGVVSDDPPVVAGVTPARDQSRTAPGDGRTGVSRAVAGRRSGAVRRTSPRGATGLGSGRGRRDRRRDLPLVDGLPLGIELAAARTALLPVAAIRDRLAARLPLPGSGPRDVPARQRTLEDTVAWSHDLLRPELQVVLHDIAVFDGGFDLAEGAVVIAPDRDGPGDGAR